MTTSVNPGPLALVVVAWALYVRAVLVLRTRGFSVARGQQLAWHAGMALIAVALLSPLDVSPSGCSGRTWPSTC